ncbi:MAG: hypothetical protein BAJALOKI3v1_530007 [Promethearchaeota archaeon]|nr:MAG: hypothetical protein BAJALOKI3v1_530007 [Candidatus Lokiarchaeota archaeon]
MIDKGILKGAERKEKSWQKAKIALREPFKNALDRFREEVESRDDFDPSALLQFGLFMSKGIINILKKAEKKLGKEGQKVVQEALIKTGYEVGAQMIDPDKIPPDISDIELMSFLATIINTQAWTSIEDPRIESEEKCSFDILWCPLQDVYSAFDCRVQRYFVQGIVDYFRENVFKDIDYQIYFKSTIPAGADCCEFVIEEKKPGEKDRWVEYSKQLEKKGLKK